MICGRDEITNIPKAHNIKAKHALPDRPELNQDAENNGGYRKGK
jgi:hypothetical protein